MKRQLAQFTFVYADWIRKLTNAGDKGKASIPWRRFHFYAEVILQPFNYNENGPTRFNRCNRPLSVIALAVRRVSTLTSESCLDKDMLEGGIN